MVIIHFKNGSIIEFEESVDSTISPRGEFIRAVAINKPDHVEIDSITYEDKVEFIAINTATGKKLNRSFYFKEDETPAMKNIKKLHVVKLLIRDVQKEGLT